MNWFPWEEEAFEKAKRENKPVLVSIGYSTCHWCHVLK
ncbi:Thymidylate kinase [Bacillus subtilis]|nr:Thymidylate kinase [Bacillus subtilis]RPK23636.1 Thymidylate kinase [Bacillus subtilis]